ncbi:MAG TPA: hydroxymethylbilane synthase, partial [Gemmatimonadales bacterium]|nr:hydroxymethylbilane synthase [Gemmatimonadales bacterium]
MPHPPSLRIGTRASTLARWQSQFVADRLAAATGVRCELAVIATEGDRDTETPLPEIGGKGVFTEALEQALRNRTVDVAVHSLKDLPVEPSPGLCLAAIGLREDPRDVLVAREPWTLATLPAGATVGTCSTRRSAQLLAARPDLVTAPLRGNVPTRVRKALRGDYDAIVLAAAGVLRLGLREAVREILPLEVMMPAPGQGALAVQCREDDDAVRAVLEILDEPAVRAAAEAERGFLEGLGGGCAAPIAAHAYVGGASLPWCPEAGSVDPSRVVLRGVVSSADGCRVVRVEGDGPMA